MFEDHRPQSALLPAHSIPRSLWTAWETICLQRANTGLIFTAKEEIPDTSAELWTSRAQEARENRACSPRLQNGPCPLLVNHRNKKWPKCWTRKHTHGLIKAIKKHNSTTPHTKFLCCCLGCTRQNSHHRPHATGTKGACPEGTEG